MLFSPARYEKPRRSYKNTNWMLSNTITQGLGAVLALHLFFFVTSAQACTLSSPGVSWNVQSPLRMMAAQHRVTTPYKRIRMESFEDADIAYPLIAIYLTNPDLAGSVDEFIIKLDRSAHLDKLHEPGADRAPFSVPESDHAAILKQVDSLGLAAETTVRMKGALDWWRETALARPSKPWRDRMEYAIYDRGTTDADEKTTYDEYAAAAAVLLLSLCPSISTLHLGEIKSETMREYLLKSNYGLIPKPGLQSLQHVVHYPYHLGVMLDTYDKIEPLRDLRYFHRLPQISSVSLEAVVSEGPHLDIFPPRTSLGIKKLHYGHVDMSGRMLSTILRIPTALEEFSVSEGGLLSIDGGRPLVDVGLLGRALDQHKETLRVLDMDLDIRRWMWDNEYPDEEQLEELEDDWEYYESLKDEYFFMDKAISEGPLLATDLKEPEDHDGNLMVFRSYTALTHLSVSIPAIIGQANYDRDADKWNLLKPPPFRLIDALPSSLEYLCLYGYRKGEVWEVDEQVEELMEKRHERLPNLMVVKGVDSVESSLDLQHEDEYGRAMWRRPYDDLDWVEA